MITASSNRMDLKPGSLRVETASSRLSPKGPLSPAIKAGGSSDGHADPCDDDESTQSADSGNNAVVEEEDDTLDAAATPIQVWGDSEQDSEAVGPSTRKRTRQTQLAAPDLSFPQRAPSALNSGLVRPDILELRKTTCSVCGELLPNVPELESHMFAHGLYLCVTCLRCFKYKRSFENHTFICKDLHRNQQQQSATYDSLLNGRGYYSGEKQGSNCDNANQEESRRSLSVDQNARTPFRRFPSVRGRRSTVHQDLESNGRPRQNNFPAFAQQRLTRPSLIPVSTALGNSPAPGEETKEDSVTEVINSDCDLQTLALAAAAMTPHSLADSDFRVKRKKLSCEQDNAQNMNPSPPPASAPPPPHAGFHIPFHPQVFLPSAVMNHNNGDGISEPPSLVWQGVQVQSEKPLVSQLEGFNPVTEQRYMLYRCCLCGHSYPNISLLASHLTAHCRSSKEPVCEKCGAIFKWRSQLEVHEQVHQVLDNSIHSSPVAGGLPPSNFMVVNSTMLQHQERGHHPSSDALQCQGHSPILHQQLISPVSFMPGMTNTDKLDPKMRLLTESGNYMKPPQRRRRRFESRFTNFNCKYCPKTFDRLFSLQRHERVHTGVKPCFCKQCGRGFSERRNLRHHIIRFHSDNNQRDAFRRQRRNKARSQNSSLKLVSFLKKTAVRILNSMEQSRGDPEPSPSGFVHQEKENSQNYEQVDLQDDSVKSNDELKVTVVLPSDDKLPRMMSRTDSATEQQEVLQDPKRSLIGSRRKGRPFKYASANQCNKDIEQIEEVTPDVRAIPIMVKEEIDSDETNNSNAFSEMLHVALTEDGSIPPDALPTFKAKLRGHGSFFSSYNPRLGVVNKPISRMEACRPQLGEDGKCVYPCSYCFKTFCSTSDLNRHMDFHEGKPYVRPFKCPYCNYHSRTNSQLKVHMMRHQGIKQYLCTTCNYNGVTQSDLNRHMKTRTHILRTRNICVCCGLGFYTRSLLEEHQRMFNHSIATAAVAAAAAACDFKSLSFSGFPLMAADKPGCNVPVPDIPHDSQSVSV